MAEGFGNIPNIIDYLKNLGVELDKVEVEGERAAGALGKVKINLNALGEGFSDPSTDWSGNISHLSGDIPGVGHVSDSTKGVDQPHHDEPYTPPQQTQAGQLAAAEASAGWIGGGGAPAPPQSSSSTQTFPASDYNIPVDGGGDTGGGGW